MVERASSFSLGLSGQDLNEFLALVLAASDAQLSIMGKTISEERKRRAKTNIPIVKVEM